MFKSNKIKIFFKYLILSIIPISFITGGDGGKWKRIQKLIKKNTMNK